MDDIEKLSSDPTVHERLDAIHSVLRRILLVAAIIALLFGTGLLGVATFVATYATQVTPAEVGRAARDASDILATTRSVMDGLARAGRPDPPVRGRRRLNVISPASSIEELARRALSTVVQDYGRVRLAVVQGVRLVDEYVPVVLGVIAGVESVIKGGA